MSDSPTDREAAATAALNRIGEILREQGLSLEYLIGSGREIRGQIVEEKYGIGPGEEE